MKTLLPIAILSGALVVVVLLFALQEPVEPRPTIVTAPVVRTVRAEPRAVKLTVVAHGTVVPRTESDLVPQVSGEVVWMSPSLVSGGFFEKGEPLVRIDRADYEVELESARAAVARARSQLSRARKERERQQRLADRSAASESKIDDAENSFQVAEATRREAFAHLARTERNLDRTELRAPYAGRVREESLDVGQFVTRGAAVAKLYAVDHAEVRLLVPDRELAFIDLPLRWDRRRTPADPEVLPEAPDPRPEVDNADTGQAPTPKVAPVPPPSGPLVHLRAEFMGQHHEWLGRVVRTEGELDPKSRMVALVARVEDPYGRKLSSSGPPLAVGLFVEAEIEGISLENAVVLSNTALSPEGDFVYVVDGQSRLRTRRVRVVRVESERGVIGAGLAAGERLAICPPRGAVDGLQVQPTPDPEPEQIPAEAAELGSAAPAGLQ